MKGLTRTRPACSNGAAAGSADILMVYPWCLDHVGHGNIQRALSLGRFLATRGRTVDLVYQGNPRIEPVWSLYRPFRRVHRVEAPSWVSDDDHSRFVSGFYGALAVPSSNLQPSAALTRLVRALLEAESYQVVLATYAWTAPVLHDLPRRVLRVLDMQDVIHEHARDCQATTSSATPFALPQETEEFLWRQWDLVLTITADDLERVRHELLPHQHALCVPHACATTARAASVGADDTAIYAGSDNLSNQAAVRWLIEEVWPRVRRARPAARLSLAGLICRSVPEVLRTVAGIDILGFRDDLAADVEATGVVVAPYLYGSGLKIKVVEGALAGKAIVTTPAGSIGTGLSPGRSIEVHATPGDFADALITLMADPDRRRLVAAAALRHARRCFSEQACYGPVLGALDTVSLRGAAPRSDDLATLARRVRDVAEAVSARRVVIWGNGSHSRALLASLAAAGVAAALVLDGFGRTGMTTPEGLPVVPTEDFVPQAGDLVVLSSETFEGTLWESSARWREQDVWVMGLYDRRRVSRGLISALGPLGRRFGTRRIPAVASPGRKVLVWHSSDDMLNWSTRSWLEDLESSARRSGWTVRLAVASRMAGLVGELGESWLPMLQLSREEQQIDQHSAGSPLVTSRLAGLVARTSPPLLRALGVTSADLLVLSSPTLPECLGVAAALRNLGDEAPAVIVHELWDPGDSTAGVGATGEFEVLLAYALADLRDASRGRFAVVAFDSLSARSIRARSGLEANVVGYPARRVRAGRDVPAALTVCLGDVERPEVVSRLRALACWSKQRDVPVRSLAWRSTHPASAPACESWAAGLANELSLHRLGRSQTGQVREWLCRAAVVVLLEDPACPRDWHRAVFAHAALAGATVLAPAATGVSRLAEAYGTRLVQYPVAEEQLLCGQLDRVLLAAPARIREGSRRRSAPATVFRRLVSAADRGPAAWRGAVDGVAHVM